MNNLQKRRANKIRKEYRNLLTIIGDAEVIADAIRATRGQWEEAVLDIAREWEFNRQDMEEVFGPHF